ncbi:MAG: hypothetical protein K8F91_09235, partial [Candidatus Obscuribacterales bacterium]|nr:hypothetical protein [Candidatus Obscuribacterales bacterium]
HRVLDADPKARIVVLNGQIHSGYDKNDDSANEILEHSFGHKSIVVEFAGGHNFETLSYLDHELSVRISLVARLVFLDQKRFCFPIDKSDDVRTADYMVHLPQVDRLPSPTELLIAPRSLPLNEFLRRLRN